MKTIEQEMKDARIASKSGFVIYKDTTPRDNNCGVCGEKFSNSIYEIDVCPKCRPIVKKSADDYKKANPNMIDHPSIGTCDTCKWWGNPNVQMQPNNLCTNREKIGCGDDETDGLNDNADYDYGISTGPKFGCSHWEGKE